MNALVLRELNSGLEYESFEEPVPEEGEVIVDLKASAFNRRDYWMTKGQYPNIAFPTILGSDGAGIYGHREVVIYPAKNWGQKTSHQSDSFAIIGMPDHGCFAEKVAVLEKHLFDKPEHLTWEEAAALPLAGLTAYRALMKKGQCQAGDKVLISGIGGGVATVALQFAIAAGHDVWVTSGKEEKLEKAKQLGAKDGILYTEEKLGKKLKGISGGFDIIIDSAGGQGFPELIKSLNSGGRLCMYGGTQGNIDGLSPALIFWRQISILGSTMGSPDEFSLMLDFVNKYEIHPVVDEVFALKDGNLALQKMAQSSQFGKLVLRNT